MDTTFLSELNWLAILVGALAFFALGAIWYSALFSKAWIRASRVDVNDPNMKKGTGAIMFTSFLFMFLTSFGLAVLQYYLEREGWMSGLKVGLLCGLCFGAAAITIAYLYEKRPSALHFINGAYTVLGTALAGIVVFSWT